MRRYALSLTSLFLLSVPLQGNAASFDAADAFFAVAAGNTNTTASLSVNNTPVTFTSNPDNATFLASLSSSNLIGTVTCDVSICGTGLTGEFVARAPTGGTTIEALEFLLDTPVVYQSVTYELIVITLSNAAPLEYGPNVTGIQFSANGGEALAIDLDAFFGDATDPVITGPNTNSGVSATDTQSIPEGTTAVFDFAADENVTWAVTGGADAALFEIDLLTGELAFLTAPIYDPAGSNEYVVEIQAEDDSGNLSTMTITVTVTDETAPIIMGPNTNTVASATDTQSIPEGTTAVFDFASNEDVTWLVTGGADAALFDIDALTGELVFLNAPTYDPAGPNEYVVEIEATDGNGNTTTMTITVTVTDATAPELTPPVGADLADDGAIELPVGTAMIGDLGADEDVTWDPQLTGADADLFQLNDGILSFRSAPAFVPDGDNTYVVTITARDSAGNIGTLTMTVRIVDSALSALERNRDDIEQIIVDAEVTKMRAQQNALRSMTSSARDRLAGGACGGGDDEQQSGATQENQSCRIDESDLAVDTGENGITVSGSNNTVRTFDGYRRIANVNFSVADDNNVRTLSFNGNFALENFRAEDALYGVFAGVSVNRSTVSRGLSGSADSYGLSLGAYAVNKLAESVFSEAYISIGRSQNQLELTDGYLDVAADYGTTEAHLGWILSGQIEKGDWDFLPELGIQMSRSQSSSIDVTGTIPGDTADVTWEGLTATLARANLSTDFRHYLGGRADDAWILNFKPGVVCERVDAITVTQGCGIAAGLGLNRTSADGAHRFAAELSVEEIEDIRRKGASLNYELRF